MELTIELTREHAELLRSLVEQGLLESYGVTEAQIIAPTVAMALSTDPVSGDDPKQPKLPSKSAITNLNERGRQPVKALNEEKVEERNAGAPGPTDEHARVLQCLDQVIPSRHRRMLESVFKDGRTPEAAASELGIQSNYFETDFLEALRELNNVMSTGNSIH